MREWTRRRIALVAKRMTEIGGETSLAESCPISIIDMNQWEWAQGVGLYGLMRCHERTGDRKWLDYLEAWFDRHIAAGLPERNVNTTCPMLTLSRLYEHTARADYLALCEDWAEWIMKEMPRTEENGLQHIVTGERNDQQLWDDTLFMTVLFLARMGRILNRQAYVDEAVRQFLVHLKYLVDVETGLLFHGWTFHGRHRFAGARWARGNCWLTVALPDFLDELGDDYAGVRWYLQDTLASQAAALRRLQRRSGLWTTLLDDPSSYEETSASAGFAYGMLKAVKRGYLPESYRDVALKAAIGVLGQIDESGTVHQVSYGTGMGQDLDDYRNIPICPMTYGQALAILMLTEADEFGERLMTEQEAGR
jgi:unsaturated rhamnogalacturonyl hydrolase